MRLAIDSKLVFGWLCLGLAACKVDVQPTCSPSATVEVNEAQRGTDSREPSSDEPKPQPDVEAKPPPPVRCPGPRHDGNSECFPGSCAPGQYCDDPTHRCVPGCVSDENCGPKDTCVRPEGDAIGRCESCGDHEAHEPEPNCVDASRTGTTACFPGSCEPGQYCVSRGLNHCEPGCASDDNCGPMEQCVRQAGAAVGVCRSCYFD